MQVQLKGRMMDVFPFDLCPYCANRITPTFRNSVFNTLEGTLNSSHPIILLWDCTNTKCNKVIVTEYHLNGVNNTTQFVKYLEQIPQKPNWPDPIKDLKVPNGDIPPVLEDSKFHEIYFESLRAEELGLLEIAGMGYRKSVEFLVKDWAITQKPQDRDRIISMTLANVIATYYTGNLKDILDRTAWLGNDATHYVRIFQDYDIHDLKELIRLVITTLSEEDQKRKYIAGIAKYGGKSTPSTPSGATP